MLLGLSTGTWMLLTIMVSFTLGGIVFFLAAKKSGQFNDVEGIKYRMLEDGVLDIEEEPKEDKKEQEK
jgi:cbb3-type cytochrome oxidase maturation protein